MKKIGIFYAPEKGSTEKVAKLIQSKLGANVADLILVDSATSAENFKNYESLIFAISTVGRDTWDSKYGKIGWDLFIPKISAHNFNQQKIGIVGLGNRITYADTFVDSMGVLAEIVMECDGDIVGRVPADKYDFNDSQALYADEFIGLPIDEDNDSELTEKRLIHWLEVIKPEMGF